MFFHPKTTNLIKEKMIGRKFAIATSKRAMTRGFCAFNRNPFSTERPAQERVVSTPEYPVPYYQRQFRAYPSKDTSSVDFSEMGKSISEFEVLETKLELSKTQRGRDIVAHVEDYIEMDSKNFKI